MLKQLFSLLLLLFFQSAIFWGSWVVPCLVCYLCACDFVGVAKLIDALLVNRIAPAHVCGTSQMDLMPWVREVQREFAQCEAHQWYRGRTISFQLWLVCQANIERGTIQGVRCIHKEQLAMKPKVFLSLSSLSLSQTNKQTSKQVTDRHRWTNDWTSNQSRCHAITSRLNSPALVQVDEKYEVISQAGQTVRQWHVHNPRKYVVNECVERLLEENDGALEVSMCVRERERAVCAVATTFTLENADIFIPRT